VLVHVSLVSCHRNNLDDYREEGEGIVRSLVEELGQVHSLEQLEERRMHLKRQFNALISLIIEAHALKNKDSKESSAADSNPDSELLRMEINRICNISGGRELLEKIQEEALHRLDAYLQKASLPPQRP
jgi:hypothetical protein